MRRLDGRWLWMCVAVLLPVTTWADVTTARRDIDGDEVDDLVLANRYLEVRILAPTPTEKRGARFVHAGWIENVVFRATGSEYFADAVVPRRSRVGFGLPDEFEATVPLNADGETQRSLKLGVGILRQAPGQKRELERAFPWKTEIRSLADGSQECAFIQDAVTAEGIGYRLVKSYALAPGSSTLLWRIHLANTGSKPIATEWYSHPFFAPGGYSEDCWHEIPLRLPATDDAPVRIDLHSYRIPDLGDKGRAAVWGWMTPPEVGTNWFAVGNRKTEDVLTAQWDFPLQRVRIWMNNRTYAIEAFRPVRLNPEEDATWSMRWSWGVGLPAVDQVSPLGAAWLDGDGARPRLRFAPNQESGPGRVRVSASDRKGRLKPVLTAPVMTLSPGKPLTVFLPKIRDDAVVTATWLEGRKSIPLLKHEPAKRWRGRSSYRQGNGRSVLLVTPPAQNGNAPREQVYLESYCRWANLKSEAINGGDLPSVSGRLPDFDAVVFAGPHTMPVTEASTWRRYVAEGGALVLFSPLDMVDSPLADILPVTRPPAGDLPSILRFNTWQSQPVIDDIHEYRVHLVADGAAPLLADLPLFPRAFQSIAQFERLAPRQDAAVIARFNVLSRAPAIITGRHGRGRVAVCAMPLAWGKPEHWIIWSRFAEFHRELTVRLLLWAMGENRG